MPEPTEIVYRDDASLGVEEAIDLYRRSTLGERRPVDRPDTFADMLRHANLTVTAWRGDRLVGISRSLTDFSYVAYLADLAVDAECQRQGIGRRLVEETRRRLGPRCMIVLLAAPEAAEYYAKIGFEHHPRAWVLRGGADARSESEPIQPSRSRA
jgi:ribosomal protein S18 acetylase RimI-like enzyme